jgi:hypothetical protein
VGEGDQGVADEAALHHAANAFTVLVVGIGAGGGHGADGAGPNNDGPRFSGMRYLEVFQQLHVHGTTRSLIIG